MADSPEALPKASWVGCGCASIFTLVMLVIVAFTVANYRANEKFRDAMTDPEKRTEGFRQVLPYDRLPEGYQPLGGMRVPGMLRMALLADATPDQPPPARVRSGFFFVRMRNWLGRKAQLTEAFGQDGQGIEQEEVSFEAREEIARGSLQSDAAEVLYYARRGPLTISQGEFGFPAEADPPKEPGIATMLLIECPDDDALRIGLWFAADPTPETPAAEANWRGTPADPATIEAFLAPFNLCA
ncbi:MAG: hypothetical protein AAF481_05365 [Acidobacteriota bacterium]